MARVPYTALGGVLLLIAFLIPFLMVIRVLEANLATLIVVYIVSIVGLVLGMYGLAEKYLAQFRESSS